MFRHLVLKEITVRLLDARFAFVFGLCSFLAVLSIWVGTHNYLRERREYNDAAAARQTELSELVEKQAVRSLAQEGFSWNRRPQALSVLVQGIAGAAGREATVRFREMSFHQPIPHFENSPFESNPAIPIFGILDLAFIVEIVLSLSVLLFTYDAICGEKEAGTLRLCSSFSVARSTLALSKLAGTLVSTLVPFGISFLLAVVALFLMPEIDLTADDAVRIAGLGTVFALYLAAFAAFGTFVSSLTQRSVLAFLLLLGLWTLWIFVLPNAAVRIAQAESPVSPFSELELAQERSRWELGAADLKARRRYWVDNFREVIEGPTGETDGVLTWNDLDWERQYNLLRNRWHPDVNRIRGGFYQQHRERVLGHITDRQIELAARARALEWASLATPLGALRLAATDLARTGIRQQMRIQAAFLNYRSYYLDFIWKRRFLPNEDRHLSDFSPFTYDDPDNISDVLARNALPVLLLSLLVLVGFTGAYVAILRYDVR